VIRCRIAGRPEIGFLTQLWMAVRLRLTPNVSRFYLVFESDRPARWS
jgi:hypothetical protein